MKIKKYIIYGTLIAFIIILICIFIIKIRRTCPIYRGVNINERISNHLKKMFSDDVEITSIDEEVEDAKRIVHFTLKSSKEKKIVLYKKSFFENRIEYVGEVKNLKGYKDYFK